MSSKSGYLDLNNNIIHYCEIFGHPDFLKDNKLNIDSYEIRDILDNIEMVGQSCQELVDSGDHGEWHCYEMAHDDGMYEIGQILIKKNILRFNCNNSILYIDSRQDDFNKNDQKSKIQKLINNSELKNNKIKISFNDTYKNIEL